MKRRLIILLFSIKLLNLNAQKADHVKGQFIVQLTTAQEINDFIKSFPVFQSKFPSFEPLAPSIPVFRVVFDENEDENILLNSIRKHPSVISAQFNHILEERITPNDTRYSSQWYHNNPGGGTAVLDADMDTDDAWNITKGGTNTDGDSIVVAVIDNGTNLSHPDLQQNLWFNRQEIPDNGIDDDRNGYVDDYRGWNAAFNAIYDYRVGVLQFANTQITYNTDCCGFSVQYRRFSFGTRNENQFRVAFSIANLGSFGTLRRQERFF